MKIYFIRGALFIQKELTYADDLRVRGLLKKIPTITANVPLVDVLDSLLEQNILGELFAIILKPVKWLYPFSWLVLKVQGLRVDSIISVLPNSKLMKVLSDFFFINTKWIPQLSGLASILNMSQTAPEREKATV